ncbi:MAG: hypothetical protein V5A68_06585, partial [Candidatus Thermoplasmatota archaeon]
VTSNLTVSIRKPPFRSIDIITNIIPSSNITSEEQWIEINFSNITLNTEETYVIICKTSRGDLNNLYRWHGVSTNNYPNGAQYNSYDNGSTWFQNASRDLCFKTYGKK